MLKNAIRLIAFLLGMGASFTNNLLESDIMVIIELRDKELDHNQTQ